MDKQSEAAEVLAKIADGRRVAVFLRRESERKMLFSDISTLAKRIGIEIELSIRRDWVINGAKGQARLVVADEIIVSTRYRDKMATGN